MAQPGFGHGLDTPRTNVGDATYLSRQPDFDISQELSFQSPSKDNNLLHQLRNGRPGGISLRTPRSRAPLGDRRNLPAGIGGAEFTPLLKSATRNSARRGFGKENGAVPNTPALDRIEEDMTPIPTVDTSRYSQNISYVDNTLPQVDTSSAASTPLVLQSRKGENKDPLQDGKQLSLREQESVIDKIEKENFGLKLKIHFLEEALRKTGPEFNKDALKENTELKVDKVTMQRELHKYKKHLTAAEKDLESYRQQMLQVQERAKKKYADNEHLAEMERLRTSVEHQEAEIEQLQRQLGEDQGASVKADKLQDAIEDLEAELREKENLITEQEDQLDDLKAKLDLEAEAKEVREEDMEALRTQLEEVEEKARSAERRVLEAEQNSQASEELQAARRALEELKSDNRKLEAQRDQLQREAGKAIAAKKQVDNDLEELQAELANKSVTARGLSRQKEERLAQLQIELDEADEKFADLEKQLSRIMSENRELRANSEKSRESAEFTQQERQSLMGKVESLRKDLDARLDEKNLVQTRHDALLNESASLQNEVAHLRKSVEELEQGLGQEREHALQIEKDIRQQYKDDIERLNDEVSDLQAEVRERDNLYDNDSEKWETDRQNLQAERDRAQEKAAGLEKTIERLREAQGSLSDKENSLQDALRSEAQRYQSEQALLSRQIEELRSSLEARQTMLSELRHELSATQDQLRQTQVDYQAQAEKIEALEDEVEVLQTTLDDESEQSREELQALQTECDGLREQLTALGESADAARNRASSSHDIEQRLKSSADRLQTRLDEALAKVAAAAEEKTGLQHQLASVRLEMQSLQALLATAEAERDGLETELSRQQQAGEQTIHLDRERLELRTSKLKLDGDVRRLKDQNTALEAQRVALEKALQDELDKAADEEARLNEEIMDLRLNLRQSSSTDGQDSSSSRRTIRELERRIRDLEHQLATAQIPTATPFHDDTSELSLVRRDLAAARARETGLSQRETTHKTVVKGLKRQIAELEGKIHDAEISRLVASPNSSSASVRHSELRDLREQLSSAHQSIHDLKIQARDSERKASQLEHKLQARLVELEEQKTALEQALSDAQDDADEAVMLHEEAMERLHQKVKTFERERKAMSSRGIEGALASKDAHGAFRQAEAEALEHDILQQQETIDALRNAEASLRRKLERARSERAAYRLAAEKLQKDVKEIRTASAGPRSQQMVRFSGEANAMPSEEAIDTVIRAAEGAEKRHTKELRGMALQMEWMQARWEREVSMRADSAYAKKFLQLELDIAHAW